MLIHRPSADRGRANFGWLDSRHSFSFGQYHDPAHMGFSDLRVINQDVVQGGAGFATHGHSDMEIITYVLRGALSHKDSLGTLETIHAGEVQRMTAGTGITHSEFNADPAAPVEFLQIWVLPETLGLVPGYQQMAPVRQPGWQPLASRRGGPDMLTVHQDMVLSLGLLAAGNTLDMPVAAGRCVWLQLVSGEIVVDGVALTAGDGAALTSGTRAQVRADAEVLHFDLRA